MKKIIFLFLCGFLLGEDVFLDLNSLMESDVPKYINDKKSMKQNV